MLHEIREEEGRLIGMYDDSKHKYYRGHVSDNHPLTSVTKISGDAFPKDGLIQWAANLASSHWKMNIKPGHTYTPVQLETLYQEARFKNKKKKTDAALVGTKVHKWIEKYIETQIKDLPFPPLPTKGTVLEGVNGFLDWERSLGKIKYLYSEFFLVSESRNYGGTMDILAEIDGSLVQVDIKTGNSVWPSTLLQMAAYAKALEEMFPKTIGFVRNRIILHINKETGVFIPIDLSVKEQFHGNTTIEEDVAAFEHARHLFNYRLRAKV